MMLNNNSSNNSNNNKHDTENFPIPVIRQANTSDGVWRCRTHRSGRFSGKVRTRRVPRHTKEGPVNTTVWRFLLLLPAAAVVFLKKRPIYGLK